MLVLGIETSCDETAGAVVADGRTILSNVVSSQEAIHAPYGGVVPELACRRHVEIITDIIDQALKKAGVRDRDVEALAVTRGPGLVGALLVGLWAAKAIAYTAGKPLIPVHHLEGHVAAIFLEEPDLPYPFVALVVSGGHTELYRVDSFGVYRVLGQTRDDAAGEAYDKVAKLLDLGYPGGPIIDRLSRQGNPEAFPLPLPYPSLETLDFSFSGIKTAVMHTVRKLPAESLKGEQGERLRRDIAAGFQRAVVEVLARKSLAAVERERVNTLVVSGGVACNSLLRARLEQGCAEQGVRLLIPSPALCTDNGAMIACAGYYHFRQADSAEVYMDFLSLDARADWPIEEVRPDGVVSVGSENG